MIEYRTLLIIFYTYSNSYLNEVSFFCLQYIFDSHLAALTMVIVTKLKVHGSPRDSGNLPQYGELGAVLSLIIVCLCSWTIYPTQVLWDGVYGLPPLSRKCSIKKRTRRESLNDLYWSDHWTNTKSYYFETLSNCMRTIERALAGFFIKDKWETAN